MVVSINKLKVNFQIESSKAFFKAGMRWRYQSTGWHVEWLMSSSRGYMEATVPGCTSQ